MLHKGYGIYYSDPGIYPDEFACTVCGTPCTVSRNEKGPTGFAEAMSGHGHLHDTWRCPNANLEWHDKAVALIQQMRDSASEKIKALIQSELDELLVACLPREKS